MPTKTSKCITLHEAVTWLMGEERRTSEAQLVMIATWLREIAYIAERCRSDWPQGGLRLADGQLIARVDELRVSVPEDLIDQLGPEQTDWPDSVFALMHAARQYETSINLYWEHRQRAFGALLQQAHSGAIMFFGRRHPNMRHEPISANDLHHAPKLAANLCDLVTKGPRMSELSSTADTIGPIVFFDVVVLEADIAWLVEEAERGNSPEDGRRDWTNDEMLAWIHHPDQKGFRDLHDYDGHQKQAIALKKQFSGLKHARNRLIELNKIRRFRRPAGGQK